MGEKSEVGEGKWKSLDQHARMELIARYRTKSFANWLTRREHFPLNPLRFLPLLNAKLDKRHERASFSDDEIYRLLTTTRASKFLFKGLVGRDRAELYHAALATGLHRSWRRSPDALFQTY